MGYLQDKLTEAHNIVKHYEYEISKEVINRKLEWEEQIAERLESDEYDGVLDIEDEGLEMKVESYDKYLDSTSTYNAYLVKVASNDGNVYVEDGDGEEYFIDDIDERTFKSIYETVMNLTEE